MPPETLTDLAEKIVSKTVFVAQDSEALQNAFGAIFVSGKIKDFNLEKVGCLFEYVYKAGKVARNGYPMFTSCQMVHQDDMEFLVDRVQELQS